MEVGCGTAGTVGSRTGPRDSKVLGNHQPWAVDCLQFLYPHIPCKALFTACFNFVPAQCSSVKPWNRWSPLRRLLPRQKPWVHAQAGSAFRRDGYTSARQLVPAALCWSARCFEDALVLGTRASDLGKHHQRLLSHNKLSSTPRWPLHTLPLLWLPLRIWHPERDPFLH